MGYQYVYNNNTVSIRDMSGASFIDSTTKAFGKASFLQLQSGYTQTALQVFKGAPAHTKKSMCNNVRQLV